MTPALSIILPVHNAQRTLSQDIVDLLNVASELVPWPEIVVVDNGSDDDTYESADELAARLPQVRVFRIPVRVGITQAIECGMHQARGSVVISHDGIGAIDPDHLAEHWRCLQGQTLERSPSSGADSPGRWLQGYLAWSESNANVQRAHDGLGGFRIVRSPATANDARSTPDSRRRRRSASPLPTAALHSWESLGILADP